MLFSQANIAIFVTSTELSAYTPDGLIPGFVAVTSAPFLLWMFSRSAPIGVPYVTAARGGFWLQYGASPTQTSWVDISGNFTVAAGMNYNVDTTSIASVASLPASPADGEPHGFKLVGAIPGGTANFPLTLNSGAYGIEQFPGGLGTNTLALTEVGAEVVTAFDLSAGLWRLR